MESGKKGDKMNKKLEYHYDKDADVMYLSIDKPQPAFTMKIAEDFILRLHPKSREVVGITIIDFSQHFSLSEFGSKVHKQVFIPSFIDA